MVPGDPAAALEDARRRACGDIVTGALPRVLGRYAGDRPGPCLLVVGGLHGNEPAGVAAARRVLDELRRERAALCGAVVAVAGNRIALERGVRFVGHDLNRLWTASGLEALRNRDPALDSPDEREARDLLGLIERCAASAGGHGLVLLDLHTTSGDSPPFSVLSDTLRNRRLALALPVTAILGLEESVDGTLLEYATRAGHAAVLVEAGRHDDPAAVDLHAAAIRLLLGAAGLCPPDGIPGGAEAHARLQAASGGAPPVVELVFRHGLEPGDGFRMRPGRRGFQRVARGEVLAEDSRGPVRAPAGGLLLMPLYQRQGDDGYFLVRELSRFWLFVSRALRRARLHRLLALLPGVHRDPARPHALRVNPRVARWWARQLFHLFGYRRERPERGMLVFTRRGAGA